MQDMEMTPDDSASQVIQKDYGKYKGSFCSASSIAPSAHSIATFKSKETLKLIEIVAKALVLEQQQQLHEAELEIKRELLELQSKKEE